MRGGWWWKGEGGVRDGCGRVRVVGGIVVEG